MPAARDPGTALVEGDESSWTSPSPRLGWTDAIRAIELDDAVRRSLRYRRAYQMDLAEANEETNFKGTMTLVGCAIFWLTIPLLALAAYYPPFAYVLFAVICLFIVLQLLRWVIPKRGGPEGPAKT